MPITLPNHIIAIGASAGSMDEINSFFDHTPLDGVSYVIVQHLSPDFKSRMVELLSRHSKLEVIEAENGMAVKRNQVYIIPNDKFMTISNNILQLSDKSKERAPHHTVNKFLFSLAEDSGKNAIAVILSGLGTDGTEGIKAIKKAGGMVIVRNPETTEFNGMPASAIDTGLVDYVLEPELMPGTIDYYLRHEGEIKENKKEDEKNVVAILNLIKDQLPFDFTDYKQTTILRRIKRRAGYHNFKRLETYLDFLKETPGEIELLAKDFLISVTFFFRDKEAFIFLKAHIIPVMLEKLHLQEELKIWIAGCATGEEAYSIAILIFEQLTGKYKDVAVKIFATDIDIAALLHAGKGIYDAGITAHVSPDRIKRHFTVKGDTYTINPEIRKMVIFAQHDLVKNPPYCNMHFISCRNLLIYMTAALQKKIFSMLLFGLKKEGYLFLGSSENPISIIEHLEIIDKKWRIYKSRETKRLTRFDTFTLPMPNDKKATTTAYSRDGSLLSGSSLLAEATNTTIADELGYLAVCIDENKNAVKSYGDTTKYLLQKNFTLNLAELLPRPLAIAFNNLSNLAFKTNTTTRVNGIKIKHYNTVISVNLSVSPLPANKEAHNYQLVIFSEDTLANVAQDQMSFDEKIFTSQYIVNIEEELSELKSKLYSANLQLEASNENMQSFNEELLSANEEMQSTNEEMQSVNEELHSINADYQQKNKELLELNDDLNNYFRSNINGQLFVNNDLLLMKFSPGTVKQINLLQSDIGRPLSHISTNIKFETIVEDIKKIIVEGDVITKEIETIDGKWYQIMTMPYLQQNDNNINGAIITFNDITEFKKTQLELKSQLRINADLDNFVYTASHDLLAPLGNIELCIGVMNEVKVVDPELNKFLVIINSSVKKFRSLINDISIIAKIESEMVVKEMIDIEEIINNIEWSLEDKIKASGASIKTNLEVTHLLFSKKNLRSILYNLIGNGIKFKGSAPPLITICSKKEKDTVVLIIEDNGIGIPKKDLGKIFDMYGRLHCNVEGNGIGLYLAKKIINAANGNIVVESEPGKGSRFIVYLKQGE